MEVPDKDLIFKNLAGLAKELDFEHIKNLILEQFD